MLLESACGNTARYAYTSNTLINATLFSFMLNAVGREVPEEIAGRKYKPYNGPFSFKPTGRRYAPPLKAVFPDESKLLPSI